MHVLRAVLLLLVLAAPAWPQAIKLETWSGNDYDENVMVRWDGTVYICTQNPKCLHDLGSPEVNTQWNALSGVLQWNPTRVYQPGQLAMRHGNLFAALLTHSGQDPTGGTNPYWRSRASTAPPAIFAFDRNGDGLDQDDLQFAVDSAPSGGIVDLACGTYAISNSVVVNKALTLRGCSNYGTILSTAPGVAAIDYYGPTSAPIHVQHIRFLGGAIAVRHNSGGLSTVNECYFKDQTTAAVQILGPSTLWSLTHNFFENTVTSSYFIQAVASTDNMQATIIGNTLTATSFFWASIHLDGAGDAKIVGNNFIGNPTYQIRLVNGGIDTTETTIVGNILSQHGLGHYNLVIDPVHGLSGIIVTGNQFNTNACRTPPEPGCTPGNIAASIKLNSPNIGNLVISGNGFSEVADVAIDFVNGQQVAITGNQFVNNGVAGTGIGVRVGGAVLQSLIAANQFTNYATIVSGTGGALTKIGYTSGNCSNGIVTGAGGC
jgi:hypothetical protein